jgi:prevent-host-death family protein
MKRQVGVRELKTRLGRYLQAVRRGSTLVVTDRGDPVAELRPLAVDGSPNDAGLSALEALGVLTRPQKVRLLPFRPLRSQGPALSEAIREDREDRL